MNSEYPQSPTAGNYARAWKSMNEITPAVQQHLVKVYGLLTVTALSAFAGSAVSISYGIQMDGFLSALLGMACLLTVFWMPYKPDNQLIRSGLLAGFGFLQGASLAPLLAMLMVRQPAVITQALVGTALVFGSFTGGALFSRRRSWLFLGAMLSSALSILFWFSIFGRLFGVGVNSTAFSVELYGGLLMFAGYVVFDTQLIVEKASTGDRDYIAHSANLFVDLFGLFVRILIILSRKEEQRERHKGRNRK